MNHDLSSIIYYYNFVNDEEDDRMVLQTNCSIVRVSWGKHINNEKVLKTAGTRWKKVVEIFGTNYQERWFGK